MDTGDVCIIHDVCGLWIIIQSEPLNAKKL